jgi:diketogulonate reductase-like aldo/keto reductase
MPRMSEVRTPRLALNDGREIPQLGFGVFLVPPDETTEAVTSALAAGYRHIDSAAGYRNEAEVGAAIRDSGIARDDVFVTTKLFNTNHGYDAAKQAGRESHDLLGLGPIDLYLIHWPVPSRDLYVETWRALIDLQSEGLVRSIGVSNFQPAHLERLVAETGVTPAVNQIELHPRLQQPALRELDQQLGILTESWSPLGRGAVLDDPVILEIAERRERTPAQVIIRWQLELGIVVLTKTVRPERMRENLGVLDFELAPEDHAAIESLDVSERIGPDPDTFVLP